jgi:hypothetical protein
VHNLIFITGHYKVPEYSPGRTSARLQISDAGPDSADGETADASTNTENETKKTDESNWTTIHVGTATLTVFVAAVILLNCHRLVKSSDLEPRPIVTSHSLGKTKDSAPYSPPIELPTGHMQV